MANFPTLEELNNVFFNEADCISYLMQENVLFIRENCSFCLSTVRIEEKFWRCTNINCRKKISVFKNTLLSGVKLSASKFILFGYLWLAKVKPSTLDLMLGISSKTITSNLVKLRKRIDERLDLSKNKIGGDGVIIEIDESKFGRRKNNRGHFVEGVWVLGGIERGGKNCFLVEVSDRSQETILKMIKKHVRKGSIIYTDGWRGYLNIENLLKIQHFTVNHSETFVDPNTGVHTNSIEGTWSGIKFNISPRNRTKTTITNHLLEYIWRKENKNHLWRAFLNLLKDN
jgi:transposase-like protein